MDYIEKLELQTEEVKEVETLEKHTIINSGSVNKYNGHTREFLALDGDYDDGFKQLKEVDGLGISCIASKEVKEARKDNNGNVHTNLKDRIDSEVNEIQSSLDNKTNLTNKHIEIINSKDDGKGVLELANFAGQGILSNIIAFILHHYTDSDMIQLDNVGSGTTLVLKNAQNASRRPDKDASYVGTGAYLKLMKHDNNLGYANELLQITKDCELLFSNANGTVVLSSNKSDDGTYVFNFKAYKDNEYLAKLSNGSKGAVLNIKNSATNTRIDIETSTNQTNGMRIKTNAGSLDIVSGAVGDEDMLLKGKRIRVSFDNGSSFYNAQTTQNGTTANRPTFTVAGQMYFDIDLNKPIWRNKDNNGWVDATGTSV